MSDPDRPPTPTCLLERLRRGAREAAACLDRLNAADSLTRQLPCIVVGLPVDEQFGGGVAG